MDASFAVESDIAQMAELNSAASTRVGKMTKAAEMEGKRIKQKSASLYTSQRLENQKQKVGTFLAQLTSLHI